MVKKKERIQNKFVARFMILVCLMNQNSIIMRDLPHLLLLHQSGSIPLRNTRHTHRMKELSSWLLHTASAFCNWMTRFEKASNYLLTWLAFGQDRKYYRPHLHLNRSSPKRDRFHRWESPRRQGREECQTERPSFLAHPGTGNGLWVELIWNKAS